MAYTANLGTSSPGRRIRMQAIVRMTHPSSASWRRRITIKVQASCTAQLAQELRLRTAAASSTADPTTGRPRTLCSRCRMEPVACGVLSTMPTCTSPARARLHAIRRPHRSCHVLMARSCAPSPCTYGQRHGLGLSPSPLLSQPPPHPLPLPLPQVPAPAGGRGRLHGHCAAARGPLRGRRRALLRRPSS